jgi:hypothetical protein
MHILLRTHELCSRPRTVSLVLTKPKGVSIRSFASTLVRFGNPLHLTSLTTLDPRRLTTSDFQSITRTTICTVKSRTHSGPSFAQFYYKTVGKTHVPFPNATNGFFYYHPGPSHAPVAGAVRFRIVDSGNPADFHRGRDLLDIHGALPWGIPLLPLLMYKTYDALASLLAHSRDWPGIAEVYKQVQDGKIKKTRSDGVIVHSLGQPLYADVGASTFGYRIAKGFTISSVQRTAKLLRDQRRSEVSRTTPGRCPYTGTVGHIMLRSRKRWR